MKSIDTKAKLTCRPFMMKWCLVFAALMFAVCSPLSGSRLGTHGFSDSACLAGEAYPTQTACAFLFFAQDDVATAHEVFSRRSYPWYDQELDRAQPLELGDRAAPKSADRDKIRLSKPWRNTGGGGGGGGGLASKGLSVFAWMGVALLIAGLAALLVWAFFKIESNSRRKLTQVPGRTLAESIEHLPFQIDEQSGDFRALAERASQAGDYRRAIVFLFSHVLVTLDQNHLIRLRKGKTNRQYLGELKRQRRVADFFYQVMVPFEAVFFGDHELTQAEFDDCWQALEQFQNEVNLAVQSSRTGDRPNLKQTVQVAS